MCKVQMLRALVKQRLTAAAEEIFGLFERTIAEYEQELCRSKEENERQQKLLDAVFKPQLRLHRADVQQLLVSNEEVPPEQQDWSPSLDQEDPEPSHIKEEQEEVWTSQEGEQLQGLEEADITKFPFTSVPVKSEDDEEKPQSSQLHQRHTEQKETEADGEDCGGPEPARNSLQPDRNLRPDTDDKTEDSSEPETETSDDDWKETREPQSGLNTLRNDDVSDERCSADVQQLLVSKEEVPPEQQEWNPSLDQEDPEPSHIKEEQEEVWTSQEGEQLQGLEEADITQFPFTSVPVKSEDDEEEPQSSQLHQRHTEQMETEADGEDCGGPEPARNSHSDDKSEDSSEPETEDSDDDRKESREPQSGLNTLRNDEVPVSDEGCSAGEKPFRCSECGKRFGNKTNLKVHMRVHTGEKPFSCSVCSKRFSQKGNLTQHVAMHTGEKPFRCLFCHERFTWHTQFKKHKCVGRPSSQFHQSQTEKNREAEPPASSSTQQMETGTDGEHCGGPEPARNSDPDRHLQPDTDDKNEDSSEPETEDSDDDWKETREPQSDLNSLKNNEVSQSEMRCNTDKKSRICSECGKRFGRKGHFIRHMRIHTGEKPFSCSVCGKIFTQKGSLTQHMAMHTGEKPFSCSVCDKRFIWLYQLKKHKCVCHQSSQLHQRNTEQKETKADGEDCGGLEAARNSDPDRHLQPDTGDKTEDSSEPDDSDDDWTEPSKTQSGLKPLKNNKVPVSDVRYKTGEKSNTCAECGKTFCSKSSLNLHKKRHTGEKPFSCSVCSKRFLERGQLISHMTFHTGEKPLSCSICGQRFRFRRQLLNHKKIHTEEKPVHFTVSDIKVTKTYSNIDKGSEPAKNMTLASSEPESEVSDDGWKGTREPQSSLKSKVPVRDMRCNTGNQPVNCSTCGKILCLKGSLKRHMMIHTGEKPFSCSVCGNSFIQKACLQLHMRIHTGEKPFSCSVCDKRFADRRWMAHHMVVHTKEKRFRCSACDGRFTWLYQLNNHQSVCDPVQFHQNQTAKNFSCSECGRRFRHRYNLKKHMRTHTKEKSQVKNSSGKTPKCI